MFDDKKHAILLKRAWSDPRVTLCHRTGMTMKGDLAWELIKRFGLITGAPDGIDDAGRSIMKPMPVADVVSRACDMAEETWSEFEKRGWFQEIPIPEFNPEYRVTARKDER